MDNAEAIKRIKDHIKVHHIGEYPHIKIAEALNMAISALANDNNVGHKVEVVRCKDCGDWREHGDVHICEHFSSIDLPGLCKNIIFTTRPDDYCSSGFRIKRSETETEENQ